MKKSNNFLKYVGPLEDLLFNAEKASSDFWIVTLNDIPYKLKDVVFHKTQKKAEDALKYHICTNFLQGHYWHKNKENTFAFEKGLLRNNGNVKKNREEFIILATQMTNYLLDQKIFIIKKISI